MLYSLIYTLLMVLAAPFLLLRGKTRRKYLHSFLDRLGVAGGSLNPEGRPAIWLHAVSVGEALAAKPLVAQLRRRLPGFRLFVSTTTATGREVAEKNLDADGYFYFPFDWRFAVRRALRSTGAGLCVVMETELWPNFVRTLAKRRIPLVLANGRISDSSYKRYRRLRWFFGPLLRRYAVLCAQSEADAERLVEIGARRADVRATGNLKFERGQFEADGAEVERLRGLLRVEPGDRVVVAGSTHRGEEEAVLDSWQAAAKDTRLVIVPRRPERFDEVAELLRERGIEFARYTELEESPRRSSVVLVDAIGVLRPLYRLAAAAFIGGSLIPHGGQNPLEACAAGVPVLFGPHMSNFREIAAEVLRHGGGRQVADGAGLASALKELLADESARKRMAEGALAAIESNQSALPLTVEAVREALARRGSYPRAPWMLRLLARCHHSAAGLIRGNPAKELARAEHLGVPTISVGGLSFGGSGKSPMVAALAGEYLGRGRKVTILTRGYGGRGPEPLVVSDGNKVLADAEQAGDEPVMLARALPGLVVVRDSVRLRGGRLAIERFAPELFILDDGFQHRAVARDLNLLMLDADSVLDTGMPCHQLREPLGFARAADAVVLQGRSSAHREEATRRLRKLGIEAPLFEAGYEASFCRDFDSGEEIPLDELAGMRLLAFCGIAVPERFALTLAGLGADPLELVVFPDHHPYCAADAGRLTTALKASGADAMITTEKDAQRLRAALPEKGRNSRLLILGVRLAVERFGELLNFADAKLAR